MPNIASVPLGAATCASWAEPELELVRPAQTKLLSMPDKAVYLLVVDGFADWEAAHAIAELRRHGGYRVESVGLTAIRLSQWEVYASRHHARWAR